MPRADRTRSDPELIAVHAVRQRHGAIELAVTPLTAVEVAALFLGLARASNHRPIRFGTGIELGPGAAGPVGVPHDGGSLYKGDRHRLRRERHSPDRQRPRTVVRTSLELIAGVAVLLILLVALIPVPATAFAPQPNPALSYADAATRIALRQQGDDRVAAPGGRSVFMTHGTPVARAVVLFHGFTNSPKQYEHLAALLYAAGDNVYVPRLPHHAERNGNARTLAALTAEELRGCADSAVDAARGLGDSVVVAGVSAGGTIAAWIAQYRPDVRRAVIVAPVFEIGRVPSFLGAPLLNLALRIPNLTRTDSPDSLRPDRELGVSTRAIAQVLRLGAAVRLAAQRQPPQVHDIVFVVNANDHTIKTSAAIDVAHRWTDRGARPVVYQFPKSLGLPHDIAEEAHPNAKPAVVYPALIALIHGDPPPPVLATHRLWPR